MNTVNKGVIFDKSDYVGVLRRLTTMIIDFGIVLTIIIIGAIIDSSQSMIDSSIYISYFTAAFTIFYLTFGKTSNFGTIGQKITKIKIVSLKGKKPNFFQMFIRLLLAIAGPISIVSDLGFVGINREKRTIRDCIANTIVVNKSATPIITDAEIVFTRIHFLGISINYLIASKE